MLKILVFYAIIYHAEQFNQFFKGTSYIRGIFAYFTIGFLPMVTITF